MHREPQNNMKMQILAENLSNKALSIYWQIDWHKKDLLLTDSVAALWINDWRRWKPLCVSGLISTKKKMCIQHSLWEENMHNAQSFNFNYSHKVWVSEAVLLEPSNKNNVWPKLNIRSNPKTVTHILVPTLPLLHIFIYPRTKYLNILFLATQYNSNTKQKTWPGGFLDTMSEYQ